ncbi:MAG: hypothetical protein HXY49_06970 [Ignavibacteriaceae bacterium]|nr:hypothetical protein [Ignavibacteriaceae bacterium]
MQYLIGMDGGGTKTKCVITDFDLNVICESAGGPSNFLMLGVEKVSASILNLISEILLQKEISYDEIYAAVLGTTGGGRRTDAELLENKIIEDAAVKKIYLKNFRVESDARIALEGAFSGKPGSILIAGTGSIMFGKDAKGVIHRVGGFGRFLGDEGSGYRIGRRGLNAVAKDFDGRGKNTLMTQLVLSEFKISSPEDLISEVYRNNFDIASAAPIVLKAAEMGDIEAQKILETEADELVLHIASMEKKLNEKILFVSLIGSIITKENYFSFVFREKVMQKFTNVFIKEPENPPEIGAALMAKQLKV